MAKVIKGYEKRGDNEVSLVEGDYVHVLRCYENGWAAGLTTLGESGFFPLSYTLSVTSMYYRRADSSLRLTAHGNTSNSRSIVSLYRLSK